MKFKKGDKVRAKTYYKNWFNIGDEFEVAEDMDGGYVRIQHPILGVGGFRPSSFELVEPAVPVFDRYAVYISNVLVSLHNSFEEADTRARGLAEGGKTATVKGTTVDKLIATYQRPVPPVEVIFADHS